MSLKYEASATAQRRNPATTDGGDPSAAETLETGFISYPVKPVPISFL